MPIIPLGKEVLKPLADNELGSADADGEEDPGEEDEMKVGD